MKIFKILLILFVSISCSKEPQKATITSKNGLFLRANPTVNSAQVILIPYDAEVSILDSNGPSDTLYGVTNKWQKVSYNGKEGWAFGSFLENQSAIISNKSIREIKMYALAIIYISFPLVWIISGMLSDRFYNFVEYLVKHSRISRKGRSKSRTYDMITRGYEGMGWRFFGLLFSGLYYFIFWTIIWFIVYKVWLS